MVSYGSFLNYLKEIIVIQLKSISCTLPFRSLNSDKETKIEHACIETFKYKEKYISKNKNKNLEINLVIGSLIILSKPFIIQLQVGFFR